MSYMKRFLFFSLILIIINSLLFTIFYYQKKSQTVKNLHIKTQRELNEQIFYIQKSLKKIIYDLLFLSNLSQDSVVKNHVKELTQHFVDFSNENREYDQLRFIDIDGVEIVRVDNENGISNIIASNRLQNKKNRYYFQNTIRLKQREVYVSKFDLNIENSNIEFPYKPLIRFSTPIYDEYNNKLLGIVIINFKGSSLLKSLKQLSHKADGEFHFLNQDAFWILSPKKRLEWAFMFKEKSHYNFNKFYPKIWGKRCKKAVRVFFMINSEKIEKIKEQISLNKFYKDSFWIKREDATNFFVRFRLYLLEDNNLNINHYIGIISDVTELFLYKDLEFLEDSLNNV